MTAIEGDLVALYRNIPPPGQGRKPGLPQSDFRGNHIDPSALPVELHNPFDQREQSVIPAETNIPTRMVAGAPLPNNNAASADRLTAVYLDAKPLAVRIAAIATGALTFFVSHDDSPFFASLLWLKQFFSLELIQCPNFIQFRAVVGDPPREVQPNGTINPLGRRYKTNFPRVHRITIADPFEV